MPRPGPSSAGSELTPPDGPGAEPADRPAAGPLADLIAAGLAPVPADLSAADRERLTLAVRSRLRGRLVDTIARAVAADLAAERTTPEDPHAQAEVRPDEAAASRPLPADVQ